MDLIFGKTLNKNRLNKKKEILKENFDNFEDNLDKLTNAGQSFYNDYNKIKTNVINCKSKCKLKYNDNDSSNRNKLLACNTGCKLKGPYYKACVDTYKGYKRNHNKKCSNMTKNRCLGGKIHNDGNMIMSDDYADYRGTTLKNGCCACGGGKHGPPRANIGGSYVYNCDQLPSVIGISGKVGKGLVNICKEPPFDDKKLSEGLMSKYKILENINETLDNTINKIFKRILGLKKYNNNIDSALSNMNINELIDNYEVNYDKLKSIRSKKTNTLNGQLNEIMDKAETAKYNYMVYIFLIGSLLSLIGILKSLKINPIVYLFNLINN